MPLTDDAYPEHRVLVQYSPVVDLILAANLATDRPSALSGFDLPWQSEQRAQLSPDALAFIEKTKAYSSPTLSLVDYVTRTGELSDIDALFAVIRADPIPEFLFTVLNGDLDHAMIGQCLANPSSAENLVGRLSYFSRMPAADLVELFSNPAKFRTELLSFVLANRTTAFERKVETLSRRYEAGLKDIARRIETKHPLDVAAELKKRSFERKAYAQYIFIPSYFEGLMNITSAYGSNFLFVFNLEPSGTGGNAQGEMISQRLRVLADRSRLEILRLIALEPSYGKEIASRLSLTTATVSRHLDQLKNAGLIIEDPADAQNIKRVRVNEAVYEELIGLTTQFIFGCGHDSGRPC